MIGYNLTTAQTPKDGNIKIIFILNILGLLVNAVLVHEGIDIVKQIYLAFIFDRNT